MKSPAIFVVGACCSALLFTPQLNAQNTVVGAGSGVGGGVLNLIGYASYAWIGGGVTNMIFSDFGMVGGGYNNVVGGSAGFSTIGGGYGNAVAAGSPFATIGGGTGNLVSSNATNAIIAGGFSNRVTAAFTFIGGGYLNEVNGFGASIAGGLGNAATARSSTIGGGFGSVASGTNSTVGGGSANQASESFATVGGGSFNTASGTNATVGGGLTNTATAFGATIGGGIGHYAAGSSSTIGGGLSNEVGAVAIGGAIGGGAKNFVSSTFGTIPGGEGNQARDYSFAAGVLALATNSRSFVWSGASEGAASTNNNSFTVRAQGGARFLSTSTGTTGVILAASATAWAALSDSNAKTDIEPVNAREVLKKVAALPVTSWHYKHDLSRRYIGPMAQDFHAAFGLGADDKTITTLDTDGVTLAAIKGLVEELEARDVEIGELKAQLAERDRLLDQRLQAIDERLGKLPPSP